MKRPSLLLLIAGVFFMTISPLYAADSFETNSVVTAEQVEDDTGYNKIVLHVQEGWHINANPASMEFLIPTEIKTMQNESLAVQYPEPISYPTALGEIKVLTGTVELPFVVPKDKPLNAVILTTQACNNDTCLAPSNWQFDTNTRVTK